MSAEFKTPSQALRFMLSGNATLTIVSTASGKRFTYKVSKAKEANASGLKPWFARRLSGGGEYEYIGFIPERDGGPESYIVPKRDAEPSDEAAGRALGWTLRTLLAAAGDDAMPAALEVWHEGACGRCGRKLTDPESIESGYGPECRKAVAL